MHYVYVLKSIKWPNKLYIGFTKDIDKRITQHNNGETAYTKQFRPWKIIYYEAYSDKRDAEKRENQLKKHAKAWGQLKRRITYSKSEG